MALTAGRRWALLGLLTAAVLAGWAGAAGASPDMPERPHEEIKCHEGGGAFGPDPGDLLPGNEEEIVEVPEEMKRPEWEWYLKEARKESEDGIQNCALAYKVPDKLCKDMTEAERKSTWLPDSCFGYYPISNYNFMFDGGGWTAVDRQFWGHITRFVFWIGRTLVQVGLWLIGEAFEFDLTQFSGFSESISGTYNREIVGDFHLEDVAWFVLISYAAIAALRGKLGVAGGELLTSMIVWGCALALLGHEKAYMDTVAHRVDEASAALLLTQADPDAPGDAGEFIKYEGGIAWDKALDPIKFRIQEQFVGQPWEYLNWGGPQNLTDAKCRDRATKILAAGLADDGGWSRRFLAGGPRGTDCVAAVNYQAKPTSERFFVACLTTAVAGSVAVLLALSALTLVITKFGIAILFALTPFAVLGGILPGTGRRLLWQYLGILLQLGATAVGMSFVLSALLLGTDEILSQTADVHLVKRWLLILVAAGAALTARKRTMNAARNLGQRAADSLTRLSPSTSNWQGGGGGGLDLLSADRRAGQAALGTAIVAAAPAVALGRSALLRSRERRVARRGLRNLEIVEQRAEAPMRETMEERNRHGFVTASTTTEFRRQRVGYPDRRNPVLRWKQRHINRNRRRRRGRLDPRAAVAQRLTRPG